MQSKILNNIDNPADCAIAVVRALKAIGSQPTNEETVRDVHNLSILAEILISSIPICEEPPAPLSIES